MFKKNLFSVLFILIFNLLYSQNLMVEYQCAQADDIIHRIKPRFIIHNTGTWDLDLSSIAIRYYFSSEGYDTSELSIDYANIGNANIQGHFFEKYLEITFNKGSGIIKAGENTGQIQLRLEKRHHGNYIQNNDYSFEPDYLEYTSHNRVTAYIEGELAWGIEPLPPPEPTLAPNPNDDWLHAKGSKIMDSKNRPVRLTGINWFGFETNPLGLGGLQAVNWMETFDTLAELGFNFIRIPLSLELVLGWKSGKDPQVQFNSGLLNPDIDQISSLKLLDKAVEYCSEKGLKIMLDMHALGNNQRPELWYNSKFSFNDLVSGWQWLVHRYKECDTVLAVDLYNEPHGQSWLGSGKTAKWDGSKDPNNWKHAAEILAHAILEINPYLLIMIEGIECTPFEGYDYSSTDKYKYHCNWWGGNLREVKNHPVDLGPKSNKIVYSPHDYGPDIYKQPWFKKSFNYESLKKDAWEPNWFYLVESNRAPILIGEWGGKLGGDNQRWMELLAEFIKEEDLHHTFWCLNPDSHDTGGLFTEDYVIDKAKYAIIEPTLWQNSSGAYIGLDHEIPLGKNKSNTNITEFYGGTNPAKSPTVIPTLKPSPTTGKTIKGDVNSDNVVNIVDSLLVAQFYVGHKLKVFDQSQADVNEDKHINIIDALLIAQSYVGLVDI